MYFLHVNLSRNCQLSSKTTRFQLRWIEETKTPCSLPGDQPVQKPDMGYPDRTNQGGQKVVVLEIAQVASSRNKNHTNFNCTNENAKTYHKRQFVVAMLRVLVIRGIKRKCLNTNLRLLANAQLNKARGLHYHHHHHIVTIIIILIVSYWVYGHQHQSNDRSLWWKRTCSPNMNIVTWICSEVTNDYK